MHGSTAENVYASIYTTTVVLKFCSYFIRHRFVPVVLSAILSTGVTFSHKDLGHRQPFLMFFHHAGPQSDWISIAVSFMPTLLDMFRYAGCNLFTSGFLMLGNLLSYHQRSKILRDSKGDCWNRGRRTWRWRFCRTNGFLSANAIVSCRKGKRIIALTAIR